MEQNVPVGRYVDGQQAIQHWVRRIERTDLALGEERKAREHARLPQGQAPVAQGIGIGQMGWIEKEKNVAERKDGLPQRLLPPEHRRPEGEKKDGEPITCIALEGTTDTGD